jgi:hypothetical protein
MNTAELFERVDNIACKARSEIVDLLVDTLFPNHYERVDGAILKLDKAIYIGGDDSICPYEITISQFKLIELGDIWSLEYYDIEDMVWEHIMILSFNELYEICACLNN